MPPELEGNICKGLWINTSCEEIFLFCGIANRLITNLLMGLKIPILWEKYTCPLGLITDPSWGCERNVEVFYS